MAVPPARTAVLHFFGVGAAEIRFVDRLPTVERVAAPLGPEIAPADSPLPLLRSRLLGKPDEVHVQGAAVTQVYGKPNGIRVLVTQIAGSGFDPSVGKKLAATGTRADFLIVRGADGPAVWIEGRPHVVRFPGASPRLAANTLIWLRRGVTVRVEGTLRRDQALRIANSLHN